MPRTTVNQAVDLSWRTAAAVLACFAGNLVIDAVVYAIFGDVHDSGLTLAELWLPLLASTALMVAVLVFPARRSVLHGRRLYAAMFLTVLGINVVLMHVEGILFLEMSPDQIVSGVLQSVAHAAWVVLVIVWLFGRTPTREIPEPRSLPASRLTARWALAAVCYTVLYLAAGMLIYPYVRGWYEAQGFTGSLWIIPLQIVRGALYVAFSLWLLRSLAAPRWQVVLATACLFPVLSGVGVPNPPTVPLRMVSENRGSSSAPAGHSIPRGCLRQHPVLSLAQVAASRTTTARKKTRPTMSSLAPGINPHPPYRGRLAEGATP